MGRESLVSCVVDVDFDATGISGAKFLEEVTPDSLAGGGGEIGVFQGDVDAGFECGVEGADAVCG